MLIKPLFFEWPLEEFFYTDDFLDSEFLIGENLLVIPNLNRFSNYTVAYLPNELFFRFPTGISSKNMNFLLLFVGLNSTFPVFIRAGAIIPFQETSHVKSTKDLDNRFKLFVSLKKDAAEGFFIGFQELSEQNLEKCQKFEFQCLWSLQFEAVSRGFMRLSVFAREKVARNAGHVVFEEIAVCGLEETVTNSLGFQGKGSVFRSFQGNFAFLQEFRVELQGNKAVFAVNLTKSLLFDEEFFFVFEREDEEALNLYFLTFSGVFFLCLQILCLFREKSV